MGVALDAVQKVLAAVGVLDVLDAQVDALFNVSRAHHLVDNDADGRLGDVVDDAGLAVVVLVRHALVHGTVCFDVDNVARLVGHEVCAELDLAVGAKVLGEQVARASAQTKRVRHGREKEPQFRDIGEG